MLERSVFLAAIGRRESRSQSMPFNSRQLNGNARLKPNPTGRIRVVGFSESIRRPQENCYRKPKCTYSGNYLDFTEVFNVEQLSRVGNVCLSDQLIRNVLAAYAPGASFCVLLDSRRPDLIHAWYRVLRCVKIYDLRLRCKVLTWARGVPLLQRVS